MTAYRVASHKDGYRVDEDTATPRLVAIIERRLNGDGALMGWRLRPTTIMRGPQSKIWPSPAAALVGFGLMTPAKARNAVAAVTAS